MSLLPSQTPSGVLLGRTAFSPMSPPQQKTAPACFSTPTSRSNANQPTNTVTGLSSSYVAASKTTPTSVMTHSFIYPPQSNFTGFEPTHFTSFPAASPHLQQQHQLQQQQLYLHQRAQPRDLGQLDTKTQPEPYRQGPREPNPTMKTAKSATTRRPRSRSLSLCVAQDKFMPVSPRTSGASNTMVDLASENESMSQQLDEFVSNFIDTTAATSTEKLSASDLEVIRRAFMAGARNAIESADEVDFEEIGNTNHNDHNNLMAMQQAIAASVNAEAAANASTHHVSVDQAKSRLQMAPHNKFHMLLKAAQSVETSPAHTDSLDTSFSLPGPMQPKVQAEPTPHFVGPQSYFNPSLYTQQPKRDFHKVSYSSLDSAVFKRVKSAMVR